MQEGFPTNLRVPDESVSYHLQPIHSQIILSESPLVGDEAPTYRINKGSFSTNVKTMVDPEEDMVVQVDLLSSPVVQHEQEDFVEEVKLTETPEVVEIGSLSLEDAPTSLAV